MHATLIQLEAEFVNVLSGLDASQCQLTPSATQGKWNIQQIVEHLLLTYDSTMDVFETRIAKGRPTQATPSLPQRAGQFSLIRLGLFPRGRLAPAKVSPGPAATLRDGTDLLACTREALAKLNKTAAKASEIFGSARCASHMVLGPLSVEQWLRFHLVHGRHHVKQIRQIRSDHGV